MWKQCESIENVRHLESWLETTYAIFMPAMWWCHVDDCCRLFDICDVRTSKLLACAMSSFGQHLQIHVIFDDDVWNASCHKMHQKSSPQTACRSSVGNWKHATAWSVNFHHQFVCLCDQFKEPYLCNTRVQMFVIAILRSVRFLDCGPKNVILTQYI